MGIQKHDIGVKKRKGYAEAKRLAKELHKEEHDRNARRKEAR